MVKKAVAYAVRHCMACEAAVYGVPYSIALLCFCLLISFSSFSLLLLGFTLPELGLGILLRNFMCNLILEARFCGSTVPAVTSVPGKVGLEYVS